MSFNPFNEKPKKMESIIMSFKTLSPKPETEAGHKTIVTHIERFENDYRVLDKEHPVKELRDRTQDNFSLGRTK